ncbi:DNA polymerase III, subunit gamma/tau [Halobacteroides halobius DSM 5150]|uniref:DNA-directed DNA polymerase n=1 Tax=Halobacteroides halobius (strain ATCC 35273 / DSM 5150 / MD-1) TaxID=748449 RepID=L0K451_HALHC|nr:DNA polymerase III subunit gamma/tau [Halobacteroides halobius]AGB40067.1 DNA polymerase III, subunit gamma/tau [Halobacteroides halobius DSM 5150]
MAYVSLYRKWRPQDFSDIAGQRSVVKTLKNAINMNRIAHAYLFCGPRGTGKTSTAKILSKALNCEEGPTIKPCNECIACTKINNNNSIDVIEIDAASNRGIDEIRELREKVKFSPTEGNYKVYIIDEVHMLTTEAFNALLKTLEEPPDYVIFILATTEPHKLLPTILSRCQRFDFSRLSITDIKERLSYICQREEIEVSENALTTIARNAEGGMRDAISILDQTISFSGSEIKIDDVAAVLGMVGRDVLFKLIKVMNDQDVEAGLKLITKVINEGKDIKQFVNDLVYHLRNLLLVKECQGADKLFDLTDDTCERLKKQAKQLRNSQLLRWVEILNELDYKLKQTNQPRIILEMGIVKLIKPATDKSLTTILDRVTRLEEIVKSGQLVTNKSTKEKVTEEKEISANEITTNDNQGATKKPKEKKQVADSFDEGEVTLEQVKEQWDQVLDYLKSQQIMTLHAVLKHNTQLIKLEDKKLFIRLEKPSDFYKDTLKKGKNTLVKILKKFLGVHLQVKYDFSRSNRRKHKKNDDKNQEVLNHPVVKEAVKKFNGKVVKVEKVN